MTISVTALYAAFFAIMFAALRIHVSILRGKYDVSILHDNKMDLALRIRRHGNFNENVPYAIVLMLMNVIIWVGMHGATKHTLQGLISQLKPPMSMDTHS